MIPCPRSSRTAASTPISPPITSTTSRTAAPPTTTATTRWQFFRGQEGDFWQGEVKDPEIPPTVAGRGDAPIPEMNRSWRQDWINRQHLTTEEDQPQAKTFAEGLNFIRTNKDEDRWFLQMETFDPHEPFFTQQHFKDLYPHEYDGDHFDWPPYRGVDETEEEVQHVRYEYAALLSMCDKYLGKVLDLMDELDMWDDTMLIVCTDHGFLLGEHDCWAKMVQPFYNEVAHTPLFIWDPRIGRQGAARQRPGADDRLARHAAGILRRRPSCRHAGHSAQGGHGQRRPVREVAIFGMHGGHVNITDGRYVYMRAPARPDSSPLFEYTLMPTHMRARFAPEELQDIQLAEPFEFTKGCRTMKIGARSTMMGRLKMDTLLFDLENDPQQENPIHDPEVEERLCRLMVKLMLENDAPREQFERMGLGRISEERDSLPKTDKSDPRRNTKRHEDFGNLRASSCFFVDRFWATPDPP